MVQNIVQNIVFDIGRVLFEYEPKHVVSALLPQCKDTSFYIEKFHNAPVWQELDAGAITPKAAAEWVSTLPHKFLNQHTIFTDIIHLIENFHLQLPPITPMVQLYQSLLGTTNVYLLTNFQDQPFDRLCNAYPFLTQATGSIVSAKEKCMKPNPEIYHILLKRYGLVPKETFFIDDKPENIKTALELGIQGIVHHSCEETVKTVLSLKNLL